MKKNRIYLGIMIVLLVESSGFSQIVPNKIDVTLSAGIGSPMGEKEINENGFVIPSFYNNFSSSYNYLIRGSYKLKPSIILGLEWQQTFFSGWASPNSTLYEGSTAGINSVSLVLGYQTAFGDQNLLKRAQFHLLVKPKMNFGSVNLGEPVFQVVPIEDPESLTKSEFTSAGLGLSLGFTYSITQKISIVLEGSTDFINVSSSLYNDDTLVLLSGQFGVLFKFKRDKSSLF